MSRSLLVWKLKLCLAAAALVLASLTMHDRPLHEQEAVKKEHKSHAVANAERPKPAAAAPAAEHSDDPRDRLASML